MPIEIKMPALSPTMEEGTLAKWLVKAGDQVKSGDILAEIETDKATMEFETIDEGIVASLEVAEGTAGVKVGAVILRLTGEDEDAGAPAAEAPATAAPAAEAKAEPAPASEAKAEGEAQPAVGDKGYGADPATDPAPADLALGADEAAKAPPAGQTTRPPAEAAPQAPPAAAAEQPAAARDVAERIKASPLARRLAANQGIDVAVLEGSGPDGRVVKADVEAAAASAPATATPKPAAEAPKPTEAAPPAPAEAKPAAAKPVPKAKPAAPVVPETAAPGVPAEAAKLSSMRKVIARRLTESKQQVPHIYLTVDCELDALLKLRTELNGALEKRGVKVSVNDLLIKAQALALIEVPACNVMFAGDVLVTYGRADISVAVSIPGGLITPIVADANAKSVATIATEMKDLSARARDGKLQPHEFQGGTASISNMGMFGIKHFDAVINPPQAMILAVGAGEKRPWVKGDQLGLATVMTVTGSFDHRAIDGADGAKFMAAFKRLVEAPLGLLA